MGEKGGGRGGFALSHDGVRRHFLPTRVSSRVQMAYLATLHCMIVFLEGGREEDTDVYVVLDF